MPSHSDRVRRNYQASASDDAKRGRRLLAELNRDAVRAKNRRDRLPGRTVLRRTLSAIRDLLLPIART